MNIPRGQALTLVLLAVIAIVTTFLDAPHAFAADRYWVGAANGSDRWETTANWSTLPRGAGGASVPGTSDQAIFSFSGNTVRLRSKPALGSLLLSDAWTGSLLFGTGALSLTSNIRVGSGRLIGSSADVYNGLFPGVSVNINMGGNFTQTGGIVTNVQGCFCLSGNFAVQSVNGSNPRFTSTGSVSMTVFADKTFTVDTGTTVFLTDLTFFSLHSYSLTVSGDLRLHGELYVASGSLNLNTNSADLAVGSGIVLADSPSSKLVLGGPLQLSGSFLMGPRATFLASGQTVTLDGVNQTLSGALMFYDLTKTVTSADTLTVTRPSVVTVSGALVLAGASTSQYLALRSSVNNSAWTLRRLGTVFATNLDLRDTNNTGLEITCTDCANYGNTPGWIFAFTATSSTSSSSSTITGGGGSRRSLPTQSRSEDQPSRTSPVPTTDSSSANASVEARVNAILERRVTLPKNLKIVERLRARLMKLYARYAK